MELTRSCSSCLEPRAETVRASLIFVGDGIVTGKAGPPCTVPFALNAFIPAGSLQLGDFFYDGEFDPWFQPSVTGTEHSLSGRQGGQFLTPALTGFNHSI